VYIADSMCSSVYVSANDLAKENFTILPR